MLAERGKGGDSNLQIKVFKNQEKDSDDKFKKWIKSEQNKEGKLKDKEGEAGKEMSGRSRDAVENLKEKAPVEQERTSGEETSEGSEQGATSKTSDSVSAEGNEGSEQGASKRRRVDDGDESHDIS